jgi:cysteine desulfurase/selenocysteine lyase
LLANRGRLILMTLDVQKVRADFPVLKRKINGRPLVYLDSACMSLKPRQVINAMNEYYEKFPACGGRSIHKLGEETSDAYTAARENIAHFINASEPEECIWTRNATESINIVARCVNLPKGSKVITTTLEHHSGSLPFIEQCQNKQLRVEIVEAKKDGTFDIEDWKQTIDNDTSMVSIVHSSNVTGTIAPIKEIVELAHDRGALVLSDDAQFAPHHPLDVQSLDIDFSAISVHKMCGPSGMGVLYGKKHLLESMDMFLVGGDTVKDVKYEDGKIIPKYLPPPEKFEAGLQNYAGAIGAGAAAKYLESLNMHEIEKHERHLLTFLLQELKAIKHIEIIGTDNIEIKTGLVTFIIDTVRASHDIATFLSEEYATMVRSGAHCVHPFHYQLGIPPSRGSVRASIYIYNHQRDLKILIEGLTALIEASA